MNAALVDGIVNAVLYEGYMLYPYRPSAVKNRQRFNFGVLYPRAYSVAQDGAEACEMQTECLVSGSEETRCRVRVRFLRMVERSLGKLLTPATDLDSATQEEPVKVERLQANGKTFQAWQEAAEEVIEAPEFNVASLAGRPREWPIRLPARRDLEPVRDERGLIVGLIQRDKAALAGLIEFSAQVLKPGLFKLTVHISNECVLSPAHPLTREEALSRSLVSTHTILELRAGEFVSLIDPPEGYLEFSAACRNIATWPVLVGEAGDRDTMLSSPIILYDYPQIAPESPGDLFDGAEIDEILSLRILTLTDEEKAEMRQCDDRARQILERTEALPDEHFRKLHGALRGLHPVNESPGST